MATKRAPTKAKKRGTKARKAPKRRETRARAARRENRPDERLVTGTIDILQRHDRLQAASVVEVGQHLLESYFGGDEDAARSREPTKARSYRLLAERAEEETEWEEADLRRAVNAAITASSLPAALAARFPATTLARLLTIDDPAERVQVARRIVDEDMTSTAARELITRAAGTERHGGRERTPGPTRVVVAAERLVQLADEVDAFDPRELARVAETAREALQRRLRAAIERLEALARALRQQ